MPTNSITVTVVVCIVYLCDLYGFVVEIVW